MNIKKKLLLFSSGRKPYFVLDDYPVVSAAYSLRKLSSAATLSVRIRRDSDDVETDVILEDFGSLSLDSTISTGGNLGSWIGDDSGFVSIWYDQSGKGIDLSKANDGTQPRIINAGVLDIENGKATIMSLGIVNEGLDSGLMASNLIQPSTVFMITKNTSDDTGGYISSVNATNRWQLYRGGAGDVIYCGAPNCFSPTTPLTQQLLYTTIKGVASEVSINGETPYIGDAGTDEYNYIQTGRYSTANSLIGSMQEIIIFGQDYSADKDAIQKNINNFYKIF